MGLVIGVVVALLVTKAMTSVLQGVMPTDPLTFAEEIVVPGLVARAPASGWRRRGGRIRRGRVDGGAAGM